MKKTHNAAKTVSFVGGFFTISASVILVVFLFMSLFGLIHPRKTRITLHTDSIETLYDGNVHFGTEPIVSRGALLQGHTLEVRGVTQYDQVGSYENAPDVIIVDETGADVTNYYDINFDYGKIVVQPIQITVNCVGDEKLYDGEPLTSGDVSVIAGKLLKGHSLMVYGGNSLLYPGSVEVDPLYRIVTESGIEVTDQYDVTEIFGYLTVRPHTIYITTGSAEKMYDGSGLSCDEWSMLGGRLLDGHQLDVRVTGMLNDAGSIPNTADVKVYDQNGLDVTQIYDIQLVLGKLDIHGIPLSIQTKSDSKIYDGKPLSCTEWTLIDGDLENGATLKVREFTAHSQIGTVDNAIQFAVIDKDGKDITHRYDFTFDYGELTLQPKAITIRTASAKKVFDGTGLMDNSYTIVNGELCEGEQIELVCTVLTEVGFSENFVKSCVIYRIKANGEKEDVTACYRINFEYGMLEITVE